MSMGTLDSITRRPRTWAAILLAAALVGAGCGGKTGTATRKPSDPLDSYSRVLDGKTPDQAPEFTRQAMQSEIDGRYLDASNAYQTALLLTLREFRAAGEAGAPALNLLSARAEALLEKYVHLADQIYDYQSFTRLLDAVQHEGQPPFQSRAQYYLSAGYWSTHRLPEARQTWQRMGYLENWLFIGPFDNERGQHANTAYGPEHQIDFSAAIPGKVRPVQWRSMNVTPNFGFIEGVVFQDVNGNGVPDAGEAGAEEAVVSLGDGQRKTLTDAQGRFTFTRIAPGTQTLRLDLSNLDPIWTTPEPQQTVLVRGRRTARLAFPLVEGGALQGRVFIDSNDDAVFQDTEEPLEGVAVVLLPGEDFRRTDADGLVQFDYLLPGAYTVKIYKDDIPGGYELGSPDTMAVTVTPGQTAEPVAFAVRLVSPVQQF